MQRRTTLRLDFQPHLDDARGRKELRDGLSSVLQVGRTLWVANDESASVERLVIGKGRAGQHTQFRIGDYIDLPAGKNGQDDEIDIEGMDCDGGYLWLVGSHSLKRCKPDADDGPRRTLKALARIESETNRYLLARIPLSGTEGVPELARKVDGRRAQSLQGQDGKHTLTQLLRKDRHLGPSVHMPGKENGLDIEGLAVRGDRVFLGLRGPVLQGWAMLLELRVGGGGRALQLKAVQSGASGRKARLRKYFLALGGLGIRDLCFDGDDLLILAGPTMSLDGPVRVLRWPGAGQDDEACLLGPDALQPVMELPFGDSCDHAEGIALFRDGAASAPRLLVVYDSPAKTRQQGESGLLADLFALGKGRRRA